MIKINLLSQRKRAPRAGQEASQLWLGLVLGAMLLELVVLFVFHGFKAEELADQERRNRELSTQIEQSKKSVGKHAELQEKLAQLRAREEAIQKLQTARSGPTGVLLELSRILTSGRGPSVDPERLSQLRRDNPATVFNSGWDARRLWLIAFKEDQRKLRLDGLARDGEDVSELARRMSLSDYFDTVRLLPAKREIDPLSKLEVVRFSVEAQVRY
jgi:type IV pilus assembly protein PilN